MGTGMAEPTGLVLEAQQDLQDRQGEQLRVAQLRCDRNPGPPRAQLPTILQRVIDPHVQCSGEGVQVGVHETSTGRTDQAAPIIDTLTASHEDPHPLELVI
jgi:hypothetical protein